ncbi:MAG TPA: hypothetical protein VH575_13680, partial [Gemmataceae bacterium]
MSQGKNRTRFALGFLTMWTAILSGPASAVWAAYQEIAEDIRQHRWGTVPYWLWAYAMIFLAAWWFTQRTREELAGEKKKNEDLEKKDLVFGEEGILSRGLLGSKLHYSVAIKNTSKVRTIKNARVLLSGSECGGFGRDTRIPDLPVLIHRSGRHSHTSPEGIDLGPGESAVFDFLRIGESTGDWDIPVAWDPNGQRIPRDRYKLTFMATGEDVPSRDLTIEIDPMTTGFDAQLRMRKSPQLQPAEKAIVPPTPPPTAAGTAAQT